MQAVSQGSFSVSAAAESIPNLKAESQLQEHLQGMNKHMGFF